VRDEHQCSYLPNDTCWVVAVLSFGLGMSVPMRFCLVVGSCVVLTFLVLLDVCC